MLLIVSLPTVDETKEAAAAGNEKAQAALATALHVEERWNRASRLGLKPDSDLPEIDGDELRFEWDIEGADDEPWTVIRCGEVLVWRELAFWEGFKRFKVVKEILKEHYGARFTELRPTKASRMYLFGDNLRALESISYD